MNKLQNDGLTSLGVILKLKKNRVIVMTDKLDFIELNRKPGMIRGQKVCFNEFDLYNSSFWGNGYINVIKKISAVASIAAVFVLLFIGYRFLFVANEYAYVDIDINPSVEMAIDKDENILKTKALNSDGQTLLDAAKVKNMALNDAVALLLSKSKEIGFLNSVNNKIILSTTFNSNTDSDNENIKTLISSLKEIANNSGVESQVIELSPEDRKEALEIGLSMGKYYIYNKAKDEGITLTVEEVKNASVESLLSKVDIFDTNNLQTQTPPASITTQPTITPSTQLVEVTPNKTNFIFSVTATPYYVESSLSTPTSSLLPSFTPSTAATIEKTSTNKPYFTSSRTYTPVYIPVYSTPTPTPTPTPAPTTTNVLPHYPSPAVMPIPTKTPSPTPRVTKTPTPTIMPTPTPSPSPTKIHINTPTIITPAPITHTTVPTTPSITFVPDYTSSPTIEPTTIPTDTPSPEPTFISTPSPTPTDTPTPTDKLSVKLAMYNEIRTSDTKDIHPRFKLTNNGNIPIKLSTIKIRYYYTIDLEGKPQKFFCDWSDIGTTPITGNLIPMSSSTESVDYYLEVGFNSDNSLEPGSNIEVLCRFGPDYDVTSGNELYNQLNDYSFNDMSGDFVNWDRATVYLSDSLIWGSEP
ncbi:anti-sigma-I factor RsgI family protein [Acetivibrio cellulolyticus]|uniref:anti-sigma-I factor RsgI family protein n=1 Tax=Acetivibrio cellulolyticus TaxID=35830 RepID=UPI0001E2D8AC|nr:cellulose binding domain-containing protein [Acetivibrio cellulolyticus]